MLLELRSFNPQKRIVNPTELKQLWFATRENNQEPLDIRLGNLVENNDCLYLFIQLEIVNDLRFTVPTVASPYFKVILFTKRTEYNDVWQVTN